LRSFVSFALDRGPGRLGRQPRAALRAAGFQDGTPGPRLHPGAKPVLAFATTGIRLECPFCHSPRSPLLGIFRRIRRRHVVAKSSGFFGVPGEYSRDAFFLVTAPCRQSANLKPDLA
jgi:hypothetical protein